MIHIQCENFTAKFLNVNIFKCENLQFYSETILFRNNSIQKQFYSETILFRNIKHQSIQEHQETIETLKTIPENSQDAFNYNL